MLTKVKLALTSAAAIGYISMLALAPGAAANRLALKSHHGSPSAHSAAGGARSGFPSAKQLASIKNYVASLTVGRASSATMTITQHVHSLSNYMQTVNGTKLVTILYHGKTYSQAGSLKQTRSTEKATASNMPILSSYAKQINNLFKSSAMKAFRTGKCKVAGRAGQNWDIRTVGPANKYVTAQFKVCTAKHGGALLSFQEGVVTHAKAAKGIKISVQASGKVSSIGKVPAYTPADL